MEFSRRCREKGGISEKTKKRKNPPAAGKTDESCGVLEREEARYGGKEQREERNGGTAEMEREGQNQ